MKDGRTQTVLLFEGVYTGTGILKQLEALRSCSASAKELLDDLSELLSHEMERVPERWKRTLFPDGFNLLSW